MTNKQPTTQEMARCGTCGFPHPYWQECVDAILDAAPKAEGSAPAPQCEFTCHDPSYGSMCAVAHRCKYPAGHQLTNANRSGHYPGDFEGHESPTTTSTPTDDAKAPEGRCAECHHERRFFNGEWCTHQVGAMTKEDCGHQCVPVRVEAKLDDDEYHGKFASKMRGEDEFSEEFQRETEGEINKSESPGTAAAPERVWLEQESDGNIRRAWQPASRERRFGLAHTSIPYVREDARADTLSMGQWQPIECAPPKDRPLWLFSRALVDADFNPEGVVEGYWHDEQGWIGAIWNNSQDCWDAIPIQPTDWMLPQSPVGEGCTRATRERKV